MGKASGNEIDYRRRLGKVIVQLREGHGVSQATLAERINRSEAALSRVCAPPLTRHLSGWHKRFMPAARPIGTFGT